MLLLVSDVLWVRVMSYLWSICIDALLLFVLCSLICFHVVVGCCSLLGFWDRVWVSYVYMFRCNWGLWIYLAWSVVGLFCSGLCLVSLLGFWFCWWVRLLIYCFGLLLCLCLLLFWGLNCHGFGLDTCTW